MVTLNVLFTGFFVTAFLRMTGVVFCCHPERSEGSRMVTLNVLFTGFFTAVRFRMTGEWERIPYSEAEASVYGILRHCVPQNDRCCFFLRKG